MIYRMQVLASDGVQYEMWESSTEEAAERFKKEKGLECIVVLSGTLPGWLTYRKWLEAVAKFGTEKATIVVWTLNREIVDGLHIPGDEHH